MDSLGDDEHGSKSVALNGLARVHRHLRNVPIQKERVLASELQKQAGEVPEIHHLTFDRDCENESSLLVDAYAIAVEFAF